MKKKYLDFVQKVLNLGVLLLIIFLPVFFLPVIGSGVEFDKGMLVIGGGGGLLLIYLLKIVLTGKIKVINSLVTNLLFLFLIFAGLSFGLSQARLASLFSVEAWAVVFGVLIYFIASEVTLTKRVIAKTVVFSGVLVSIFSIIRFIDLLGQGKLMSPMGEVDKQLFLPDVFGNSFLASVFLAGCVIMGVWYGVKKAASEELKASTAPEAVKIFWIVGAAICLAGLLISSPFTADVVQKGFGVSFGKPKLLDLTTSWQIGVESFKYFPLCGYGPGVFDEAFSRFRPVIFNLGPNWNLTFSKSGSWVLELLTLYGGFAALIFTFIIAYILFNVIKKVKYSPLMIFAVLLAASFLVLPYSTVNWVIFFVVLGVLGKEKKKTIMEFKEGGEIVSLVMLFLVMVGVGAVWYVSGRIFLADINYKRYQDLIAKKKVSEGYENFLLKAMELNPYNIKYGISASQVNFVTARDLSNKKGKELTDEERQALSQLLQRAVTIARETAQKNPNNVNSWLNLATIYRGVINVAKGADVWTVESYQRAINVSANNPVIHFALGGFYYGTGNYQLAVNSFTKSVSLKPNFANGFYNLAWSYRQQGMWQEAELAMEKVIELIGEKGPEYKKAKKELEEIRAYLPKEESERTEQEEKEEAREEATEAGKVKRPAGEKEKGKLEKPKSATESGIRVTPTISLE